MSKILLLCDNQILNVKEKLEFASYNVHQLPIYSKCNLLFRIVRKIHLSSFLPFKSFWYDDWITYNDNYDVIILFDSILSEDIFCRIQKKFNSSRLIFWYWNIVKTSTKPSFISKYRFELWTFDALDSLKYQLNLNTQFYYPQKIKDFIPKYDVFFIGRNYGRLNKVLEIQKILNTMNLNFKLIIVSSRKLSSYFFKNKYELNSVIPYEAVLDYVAQSKCILEINQSTQTGLTIRALESLFYKKKLITNNKSIVNFDFYTKENVFIIDFDNFECLDDFIKAPYTEIDETIVLKYHFNSWLNRFNIPV